MAEATEELFAFPDTAGRQRVANRAGHVVAAHPSAGQAYAVPRLRRAASRADVRDGRAGDLLPAPGWFVGRGPRPDQIIFEQTIRLDPLRSRIARAARRSPQEAGRMVKRRGGQCNRPPCVAQWPTNHSPSHPSPTRTPDRSWCPATQTTFSSSSSPRLAPDLPRSGRYRRSGSAGSRLRAAAHRHTASAARSKQVAGSGRTCGCVTPSSSSGRPSTPTGQCPTFSVLTMPHLSANAWSPSLCRRRAFTMTTAGCGCSRTGAGPCSSQPASFGHAQPGRGRRRSITHL